MKSREHMEVLLNEKGDVYYKDEIDLHVLMYAEFDSFIFIDYLWVSAKARGQGIGHLLIEKLKKKNKPIILEVEPIDYEDLILKSVFISTTRRFYTCSVDRLPQKIFSRK